MMLPTEPTIIAVTAAITCMVVLWFAHTILGMRDLTRDMHHALFGHDDRPGALDLLDGHTAQLKRHSDALRVHGILSDE